MKSKIKNLLFLTLFLLSLSTSARKLTEAEKSLLHGMILDLRKTTHSTLDKKDLKIKLFEIDNPDYFFVSNFGASRALLGKSHYRIGVNPLVFDKGIPNDALLGVLAHELIHTEDYVKGSTLGTLIPIGIKVSFKNSRIQYERKTDLKVIMKGYAEELMAYKNWQYQFLSDEALKNKKKEYLSPEEIKFILNIIDANPHYADDWQKRTIPRNLEEFKIYHQYEKKNFTNESSQFSYELEKLSRHHFNARRTLKKKYRLKLHFQKPFQQTKEFFIYRVEKGKINLKKRVKMKFKKGKKDFRLYIQSLKKLDGWIFHLGGNSKPLFIQGT